MKWDHRTIVLKFSERTSTSNAKNLVQGLDNENEAILKLLGMQGWELVTVVPFSAGGFSATGQGIFSASQAKTNAAIAFLKKKITTKAKKTE